MPLAGAAVAALLSGPVLAGSIGLETLYGGPPAPGDTPSRVVRIDSSTRWLNATEDEVVKFVVRGAGGGEQSFDWQFPYNQLVVDLSKVAPAGMIQRPLCVYLAPHPWMSTD